MMERKTKRASVTWSTHPCSLIQIYTQAATSTPSKRTHTHTHYVHKNFLILSEQEEKTITTSSCSIYVRWHLGVLLRTRFVSLFANSQLQQSVKYILNSTSPSVECSTRLQPYIHTRNQPISCFFNQPQSDFFPIIVSSGCSASTSVKVSECSDEPYSIYCYYTEFNITTINPPITKHLQVKQNIKAKLWLPTVE